MDAVITYVNGLDPVWQKSYAQTVGMETFLDKRFRDWGTLKYLLRGIQTHMPFVENVYLIVSGPTQVPDWADTDNLHIVYHSDIIPEKYLPVFNSTAIELFMYRIPGLSEQFIYFNDDFFPVSDCSEQDFYKDGKAVLKNARHLLADTLYYRQVKNSDRLARKASGTSAPIYYIRPQHICTPLLKSSCEEIFSRIGNELEMTVSKLRDEKNVNYYVFSDYMKFTGKVIEKRLSKKHFTLAFSSIDKLCKFLASPDRKMMCVNDVRISQERFEIFQSRWIEAFEKKFPSRSRFEK